MHVVLLIFFSFLNQPSPSVLFSTLTCSRVQCRVSSSPLYKVDPAVSIHDSSRHCLLYRRVVLQSIDTKMTRMKTAVPTTLLLLMIVLTATVPVVHVQAYIAGGAVIGGSNSSNSPLIPVVVGPSWHHGHARQDASTSMTCRMTTRMKTLRVLPVPVIVPAREGFRKMTWLHEHLYDMDNVEEEEDGWETRHEIGGNGSEEDATTTSQSTSLPVVVSSSSSSISRISKGCKVFSTCMPLWTVLVAFYASRYSSNKLVSMVASMGVMQHAFLVLMVAMGLAIERIPVPVPVPVLRDDGDKKKKKYGCDSTSMGRNVKPLSFFVSSFLRPYLHPYQYRAIVMNALLCFGMMPLLSCGIASVACQDRSQQVGMILLGCVSGGQASNLFALLAGGDVTLSILCTLTTTLLGVIFTPLWIRMLLRRQVVVVVSAANGWDVLQSVARLVLVPVTAGMLVRDVILFRTQRNVEDWNTASVAKDVIQKILCPTVGILATLILVAGGAANSAMLLDGQIITSNLSNKYLGPFHLCWYWWKTVVAPSCLLPVLGGAVSWLMITVIQQKSKQERLQREQTKRTLVVETLSKSPTLAYVLAQKHFGQSAATIPAMSMVTLAVVGAAVASLWSILDPIERYNYNDE